jgi:hypothetical protein
MQQVLLRHGIPNEIRKFPFVFLPSWFGLVVISIYIAHSPEYLELLTFLPLFHAPEEVNFFGHLFLHC